MYFSLNFFTLKKTANLVDSYKTENQKLNDGDHVVVKIRPHPAARTAYI